MLCRLSRIALAAGLAAAALAVAASGESAGDRLERAQKQYDRHNYRAALEVANELLAAEPDKQTAERARLIRGLSLVRLRDVEQGMPVLVDLLEESAEIAGRPDVHEVLAQVGLEQWQYRYLAVRHFEIAADLHREAGENLDAAQDLIKKAEAYVGFSQWEKLPALKVPAPDDWRDARHLQRKLAVAALDRAMMLAGDDPAAAEALFLKAELFHRRLQLDPEDLTGARTLYLRLVEEWPDSPRAAQALLHVGQIEESHKQDYVAAAATYRRLIDNYADSVWARRARNSLHQIIDPTLQLSNDGPFLPGEPRPIHFRTRNVAEVTFRVYEVELFDLVRKIPGLNIPPEWAPADRPVATWTLAVPDEGKHEFHQSGPEQLEPAELPIDRPGAFWVLGSAEGTRARGGTLVIVSRLAAVAKSARSGTLVTAADAQSGKPAGEADVLIHRHLGKKRYDSVQGKCDHAGRFKHATPAFEDESRRGNVNVRDATIIVREGPHYAVLGSAFSWHWWGHSEQYRAYCFTERPVYRPDHTVHFKAVVRANTRGEYETVPDLAVQMQVRDPLGEIIENRRLSTDRNGSIAGDLQLPDDAALGMYFIELTSNNQRIDAGSGARFRVEEYRKPEFEVSIEPAKPDYRLGDTIEAKIVARYYFGEPVPNATVRCTVYRSRWYASFPDPTPWPWYFDDMRRGWADSLRPWPWRRQRDLVANFETTTDENGVALVRINTEAFANQPETDLEYEIEAGVTGESRRLVKGSGTVVVTHQPFFIHVRPQRKVYQPGDNVRVNLESRGPNDDPVRTRAECKVYRLQRRSAGDAQDAEQFEYELGHVVHQEWIEVDETGRGHLKWVADEEGPFRIVATAEAEDGSLVTGSSDLWIARHGGRFEHYAYRDVELVTDRLSYQADDTANILINTRLQDAYVLITAEADDHIDDRLVYIPAGTKLLEYPVTKAHVPNFYLSATVLKDNAVYQDEVEIIVPPVDRFLDVEVKASADTVNPREEVPLTIRTTNHAGEPAPADVAVMIVDSSIYYIQPELRQAIEKFFYGRKRPDLVQTTTSYDRTGGPIMYGMARRRGGMTPGDAPRAAMAEMAAPTFDEADAEKQGAAEFAQPEIRKDFPDTVLWAAHVTTGDDGTATVDATMPDTLTTWKIHAVAADRDTRVGQTSIDLVSRKDVIARLQAPRFLVDGDQVTLSVIAHNYLDVEKRLLVKLEAAGGLEVGRAMVDGDTQADADEGQAIVTVPPDGQVMVDFPCRAVESGEVTLTGSAAADTDADAIQVTLPVVPFGADQFYAETGVIRRGDAESTRTVNLDLPDEMQGGTQTLEVHLSPSTARVALDALPYLLDYPYGCTEQTVSRFLPAVVVRRTLQQLGLELADLRRKIVAQGSPQSHPQHGLLKNPVFDPEIMNAMIDKGLKRLADLQHGDGGWGWWAADASNPYMSAYVVYGLSEARASDLAVDGNVLKRGADFLFKRVTNPEPLTQYSWQLRGEGNVRAWMLYALSAYDADVLRETEVHKALLDVYEGRDALTDYGRALLMVALHRAGLSEQAGIVVENLYNTVRIDEKLNAVSWGDTRSYWYWYDNGVETTAMVLRALLTVEPDHHYVPMAVNWLVHNRRGAHWHSTKETAQVVYALAEYMAIAKELQADMTVNVGLDGRRMASFRITPENALTFDGRLVLGPDQFPAGMHKVDVSREGDGSLYYATYLTYVTTEDPIPASGHQVSVSREYVRLTEKVVTKTRRVYDVSKRKYVEETYDAIEYEPAPLAEGEPLASGDMIEVRLTIEASNNFEYMIFEDPKPAGCEPVEMHSGRRWGSGPCVNVELRDQKVAFFATYLQQGEHKVSYRLRCETPGGFRILPSESEAMYSPYVKANSRSDAMSITDSQ